MEDDFDPPLKPYITHFTNPRPVSPQGAQTHTLARVDEPQTGRSGRKSGQRRLKSASARGDQCRGNHGLGRVGNGTSSKISNNTSSGGGGSSKEGNSTGSQENHTTGESNTTVAPGETSSGGTHPPRKHRRHGKTSTHTHSLQHSGQGSPHSQPSTIHQPTASPHSTASPNTQLPPSPATSPAPLRPNPRPRVRLPSHDHRRPAPERYRCLEGACDLDMSCSREVLIIPTRGNMTGMKMNAAF